MRIFGTINKMTKQDDGSLLVEGIASSESRDSQKEIITANAMKTALPDYMKFANVREMHQPKAAGVALECEVIDGHTMLKALIVDPVAIIKVESGVYKGFSIGGKVTSRDSVDKTIITGIDLSEISLVDRPANPDSVFSMYKMDGIEDEEEITKVEDEEETIETVEQVVKLGDADVTLVKGEDGRWVEKVAETMQLIDDVAELQKQVAALTAERDDLAKRGADVIASLNGEDAEFLELMKGFGFEEGALYTDIIKSVTGKLSDLQKKFDALPAPPKGVLITKVNDNGESESVEVPLPSDPEAAAKLLIKSAHQRGGFRIGGGMRD